MSVNLDVGSFRRTSHVKIFYYTDTQGRLGLLGAIQTV